MGTPLWVPLAVALIAAAAMLVNARVTAGAAARRERDARRAEHEAALLDVLRDATLALRAALSEIAARAGLPSTDDSPGEVYYRFVLASQSVGSERVRRAADAWAAAAAAAFSGDPDAEPGSAAATWDALLVEFGLARRNCV